ncbi:polyphosphate kinase 1 [Archangium lipolyticum]|uniref:polyphosphate kinase 1 n=1 Tax=Archangium lipolyticum TaxID=2970465 RepID=UPI00214A5C21|nr:polyphosphate kinase 1 [Archangium lipolyticum]
MQFNDPQLFINRELSWLAFNERVLDDARDRELPLYERLKFFAIASSNLDEFFMVRVAGLKQQLASGVAETAADGMLPAEQLSAISERVHRLVDSASRLWVEELQPGLMAAGVCLLTRDKLTAEQKAAARTWFTTTVFPALTPLAVDPGHPFPHLRNKSLNVAVLLRREGPKRKRNVRSSSLAVVQVPSVLRQLVPMPVDKGLAFLLLGEVIALCAADLFPGYVVEHTAAFRVTRNWDLNVDDEESEDLLSTIQDELRRRDRGAAVRLELDATASPQIESLLTAALKLGSMDVYRQQAPLQPSDVMGLLDVEPRPELRVEPFTPAVPPVLRDVESLLGVIAERDVVLHHPYESFDPVVRFLEEAAEDPDVLAIKQTLYRTSGDSPIARALSRAVENGKQVAVLVEIKARLDEANNIAWARKMEESGVHVVYGLIGLKTHAKVVLVVRREGNGIRRYVHLGTGNYNPHTARLYTDLSLFTSREEIADDVSALFNMLTGYAVAPQWKRLAVAPMGLQERVLSLIQREAEKARRGEPARIVAKMNSLVDSTVIRALYAASQAGVEIDLLVRGICCLRPGVPGVSERIRVTSVVDRFLEHSRVFAFGAGSNPEVWMSSADWMPRNFLRRVEVMFPVEDPAIRQRLLDEVLGVALADNVKARRLQVDGSYVPVGRDGRQVRSQAVLMEMAKRNSHQDPKPLEALRHATAPDAPVPSRQVPQATG